MCDSDIVTEDASIFLVPKTCHSWFFLIGCSDVDVCSHEGLFIGLVSAEVQLTMIFLLKL